MLGGVLVIINGTPSATGIGMIKGGSSLIAMANPRLIFPETPNKTTDTLCAPPRVSSLFRGVATCLRPLAVTSLAFCACLGRNRVR